VNTIRRRALLRLVAAGALAPALAGRGMAHEVGGAFEPPLTPLLYTRRLVRGLRGGYRLTVTRSFAIRFAPRTAGGYEVGGEQVAVEVAAPEKIASFAELERNRIETGLFPLKLDDRGLIERGPGLVPSELLDQAVAEARRMIGAREAPSVEQAEAESFVQLVHQTGVGLAAHLPPDLFAPASHSRTEWRAIELPGGEVGEIEVLFIADADPRTGLMSRARREIATVMGGDRRTTEEDWILAPA